MEFKNSAIYAPMREKVQVLVALFFFPLVICNSLAAREDIATHQPPKLHPTVATSFGLDSVTFIESLLAPEAMKLCSRAAVNRDTANENKSSWLEF